MATADIDLAIVINANANHYHLQYVYYLYIIFLFFNAIQIVYFATTRLTKFVLKKGEVLSYESQE
ncbi:MAG: hypothetical protein COA71_06255 [SAR86 cluster bacterium]|uniref:Uncharacterized protein n=1 Tax=SAR86 cluster bacterium TaxID=2030880 RepID=A0A2A5CF92_9GAMM|nr:MAG: hypothetical protein COA71_06255 [SAR86 cluster bacterium]